MALRKVRHRWQKRSFDFSMCHKLPGGLQALWFVDTQRILNPSNNVTATTAWLAKCEFFLTMHPYCLAMELNQPTVFYNPSRKQARYAVVIVCERPSRR